MLFQPSVKLNCVILRQRGEPVGWLGTLHPNIVECKCDFSTLVAAKLRIQYATQFFVNKMHHVNLNVNKRSPLAFRCEFTWNKLHINTAC